MKSKFIATIAAQPSEDTASFRPHLKELVASNEDLRSACLTMVPQFRISRTDFQRNELFRTLAQQHEGSPNSVEAILTVANYFVEALLADFVPGGDENFWAEDLIELKWMEADKKEVFQNVVQNIKGILPRLKADTDEFLARAGVLPKFKSLGITVEMRAIRSINYRWGTPIKEYSPQITGMTPIASVHMGVEQGIPDHFFFQVDEEDIVNIITSFLAAQKEMQTFRVFLNATGKGGDQ